MNGNHLALWGGVVTVATAIVIVAGCSGPQPLSQAIRPADEDAYFAMMQDDAATPRESFYRWKAEQTHSTVDAVQAADQSLSTTKNPFDARRDPVAVSRGAVIFKYQCINCHGENADGTGPDMPVAIDAMDFHRFGMRFAVTLHHGAPKRWFKVINEGVTSDAVGPEGEPVKMEPFAEKLAREQIWQVITYIQSLDRDIVEANDDGASGE